MRIHELAKELGVASKEILESLQEMGYEGRTASSTVPDEAVPRLRASGGKVKPGSKPRAATADQLPTRRPVDVREPAVLEAGDGKAKRRTATAVVEAPPAPPTPVPAEVEAPAVVPEPS